MNISALQLDFFHTNGYLVLDNFFPAATCNALMQQMQQLITNASQSIPQTIFSTKTNEHALTEYFLNSGDKIHYFFEKGAFDAEGNLKRPLHLSLNKVGHALHELDPIFRNYSYDSRIYSICQQLGLHQPCLLQSMYIFKHANIGAEVDCHQDATFLHSAAGSSVLGFWFALEDATLENGCLQVLPCPTTTALKQKMLRSIDDKIIFEEYQNKAWPEAQCIPLQVKQGTLILLHGNVPHKSEANISNKSRHAYTLHAIDASLNYPTTNWLRCTAGLPKWPQT